MLGDNLPAVAVDRERHDGMRKTFAVVVQIQDRVRECVTERMMKRLVGIGSIETGFDQSASKILRGRHVTGGVEFLFRRLIPDVVSSGRKVEGLMRRD